jgi:catechol-2,3-dioxygenase
VPESYDAGINRGLGVPAGFYHFAFEAGSEAALAERRDKLSAKGVEVSDVVDHGWAKSIYFRDPNGLSLEYCCLTRDLRADDAVMHERGTIPLAALNFDRAAFAEVSHVQSPRSRPAAASAAQ